jgi:hypothetical protein
MLTPGAISIKKSARVVALLLANTARREHQYPPKPPQPSLRKDKSTALRATHSPATPRKGPTPRGKYRVACKMLKSPHEGLATRPHFAYKIFGLGPITRGVGCPHLE